MRRSAQNSGYTFIELIIGVSIFLTLLGLTYINFTSLPSKVTLNSTYTSLLNDIKNQQSEAMMGSDSFGIYFNDRSYVLFKGSVYTAANPTNFQINLENNNLKLDNILFSNQTIVFERSSGEITGFAESQNSVDILDELTQETKTLRLNKYGTEY